MNDPVKPRTELRIVNIAEDGSEEIIEGVNLDMRRNDRMIAQWGVNYPEAREEITLSHVTPRWVDRGRPYFHFHVFAPMIEDDDKPWTVTLKEPQA